MARAALAPFGVAGAHGGPPRIEAEGPAVLLAPEPAVALAMALHELATNAAKYGALSDSQGRVALSWTVTGSGPDRRLRLDWTERDGPPVSPPARRGFGSRLIQSGLATELDGEVTMDYPSSGVICRLDAPLPEEGKE